MLLIGAAMLTLPSLAQVGGSYNQSQWTVDGGGNDIASGTTGYAVQGTIGQPDTQVLTGGNYALRSGFWVSSSNTIPGHTQSIYLPFLQR